MSAALLVLTAVPVGVAWGAEPAPAVALGHDVAEIVDRVQQRYADVEVLQASFVQVTKSPYYGEEEQRGTVVMQRPSKMRWLFDDSGKQFVTDGDTMWIYTPAAKQVLRFRDFSAQSSTANSLLQSLHKVGDLFEVELLASEIEGGHTLSMVPKDAIAKTQVKSLVLSLDSALLMQELVITDPSDSVTDMTFSGVKLGGEVPEDTFRFEIPEGVEVIDTNPAG
ncbi:MAG TPA: outer membrane lipoprotein carrier protein LolA [Deltaproteobacteria bacterium]|nr:outer membrane lipoprotein carrier protein LolA [Deltaproteobacteria bacterium]